MQSLDDNIGEEVQTKKRKSINTIRKEKRNNELRNKVYCAISCNNYESVLEIFGARPDIFVCGLFSEEQIKKVVSCFFNTKQAYANMRRQMCAQARKENNMVFLAVLCPEHSRFDEMYRVVMEHRDVYKLRELWGWSQAHSVNTYFGNLLKDEFIQKTPFIPRTIQNDDLKHLFILAARYDDVNIIQYMLEHNLVDPNAKIPGTAPAISIPLFDNGRLEYPLYVAIRFGSIGTVTILYPLWNDRNNDMTQSPFKLALCERQCSIVDFVLDYDYQPPKKQNIEEADDTTKKNPDRNFFCVIHILNSSREIKCDHCFQRLLSQFVLYIPFRDVTTSCDVELCVTIVKKCWERKQQHLISVLVQHLTTEEVIELYTKLKFSYSGSGGPSNPHPTVIFDAYFSLPNNASKKTVVHCDVTISFEMILYCIEHGYEQHAMELLATTPVEDWETVLKLLKKVVCSNLNCSKSMFEFLLQKFIQQFTTTHPPPVGVVIFPHLIILLNDCISCTTTNITSTLSMTQVLLSSLSTLPHFNNIHLTTALRLALDDGYRDIVQSLLYYLPCIPFELIDIRSCPSTAVYLFRKGFLMDIVKKVCRKKICQIVCGSSCKIKIILKIITEYAISWTDIQDISRDAK